MSPKPKTLAVVSYLTFIGLIIAYFINREDKSAFATWHIKNMFGLVLILFISQAIGYSDPLVGTILWWVAFVSWLVSLIMAASGKKAGIPWLSEQFQKWFLFLN